MNAQFQYVYECMYSYISLWFVNFIIIINTEHVSVYIICTYVFITPSFNSVSMKNINDFSILINLFNYISYQFKICIFFHRETAVLSHTDTQCREDINNVN